MNGAITQSEEKSSEKYKVDQVPKPLSGEPTEN